MKLILQSYEIWTTIDGEQILKHIERCGRVAYRSEQNTTPESAAKFVRRIIQMGHESVLEHTSITVAFTLARPIANELVRHRLASYTQESTRYCAYGDISFVPPWNHIPDEMVREVAAYLQQGEILYNTMRSHGVAPQHARDILPSCLATKIVTTANLREWRHIFKLRCDKHAHPDISDIMKSLLGEFYEKIPAVFDDLYDLFCGNNGESNDDVADQTV